VLASGLRRRRRERRVAPLWDPLGHHIRTLRAGVAGLVPDLKLRQGSRLLDFGCGASPYRELLPPDIDYVGADLDRNPKATLILTSEGRVPGPDAQFDAVLSTQVLEHVRDPRLYLSECFRVLRPGGRLLLTTHGIFFYHPDPIDLWRWTCEGLTTVVEESGLVVERQEGIIGLAATGLQQLQDALTFRAGERWSPWLAAVFQPLVALADRFETRQSLGFNAQVFAVIADRP
jgi:SAM-dependent methyltransferase